MEPNGHKGWYENAGGPPHVDGQALIQFVTFRLADSVPADVIRRWEHERLRRPSGSADASRRQQEYLDRGAGRCELSNPSVAEAVEAVILGGDNIHYQLIAWCIMPNHVHVLFAQLAGVPLSKAVRGIKVLSSKRANLVLGRSGTFWARQYFDRFMRDEQHLRTTIFYIHNNPVRARLAPNPRGWRWSSAGRDDLMCPITGEPLSRSRR